MRSEVREGEIVSSVELKKTEKENANAHKVRCMSPLMTQLRHQRLKFVAAQQT